MTQSLRVTAIIEREDEGFVSLCLEFDIASQGSSIEEARANLVEALSLFFETADRSEVSRRFRSEIFVTQRGRHRIMQKRIEGTTLPVGVPLHNPFKRGTLSSIIRQSEAARAHFETAGLLFALDGFAAWLSGTLSH
jgi:predicted RNase H-like HicB family nuclease